MKPFAWSYFGDDTVQEYTADFQIDDGHFITRFREKYYERGYWELSFYRNGILDLTGTGNAATVISTVMQITREFIAAVDPRFLCYAAKNEEASRNRLYPKLMAKLMREFPQYSARQPKKLRTYTSYDLERPAKPFAAPDPEPESVFDSVTPLTPQEWEELERFMDELQAESRK